MTEPAAGLTASCVARQHPSVSSGAQSKGFLKAALIASSQAALSLLRVICSGHKHLSLLTISGFV